MSFVGRHKKKLAALAFVLVAPPLAHVAITWLTPIRPPHVELPSEQAVDGADGIRRMGPAYTRVSGGIREVYVEGSPERIGTSVARLLRDRMLVDEQEVWDTFSTFVPLAPVRTLLTDLGRVRYRHVDQGFPEARRRELAAQALAFQPDPYESHMPSYPRMVFLHSVYDIALSFEHSPLLGCSAFGLGGSMTASGDPILARAFDFEAGEVFDRDKVVYFVREDGAIPFASVAWPGLIGVMSGMNLSGVAVVVNGARAHDPQTVGEPVIFMLRDVLEQAHDTDEAIALLSKQTVMVSHIVFVGDAKGHFAVVERAPGAAAFVRHDGDPERVAVTNHFEGPLASDPKNQAVRAHTTTLPRRARLDEMLGALTPGSVTDEKAIGMLRDHTCAGKVPCELGDRRTIDALIATHGIVADTKKKTLWVSAGPHLSGHFVRFDLERIFAPGHDPAKDPPNETVPDDPILHDGRYAEGRARAGGPRIGGDAR